MIVLRVLGYAVWLLGEVVAGSWQVAVRTCSPRRRRRPMIVELPLRCRTDLEVVAFTSSITITPGTLVVGVARALDGGSPTIFVHALLGAGRDDTVAGLRDMESRLLRALRGGGVDR